MVKLPACRQAGYTPHFFSLRSKNAGQARLLKINFGDVAKLVDPATSRFAQCAGRSALFEI
ncbi:hypothetical protein A2165_00370 [Candidatus Curtissbacteria bacterium RBG_13_40_7]|uniref:Uncharacterized protein n=1 Tax=Candidatus Curtissbacteria bacterium RBG_13_40_7 TaxID=1797706 RepID=A0A1F5FTE5_9BACT|nr:MAG: hypothetical protein A2165_00370 [Candidatus Curtissbacteria bacterium RBG_13_40_7]